MIVSDYLRDKFCLLDLKSTDKDGAIKEVAEVLAASGKVIDLEVFIKDVL